MKFRLDDYIDADVAYLMGLIIGRGTISEVHGIRQITIHFPHSTLQAQGIESVFDQQISIKVGLINIQERLQELLDTNIKIVSGEHGVEFVIRFMSNNMMWRNILLLTNGAMSYAHFHVPPVFFDPELPRDIKREFIRGYADVAGNIRHANRYIDNRHRVRLDVLNYPTNWEVPVQLCTVLEEHLDVPVQLITWGHPNLGRDFREHQINIFARPFLQIGFSFEHKQKILEEFVEWDAANTRDSGYDPCPGFRPVKGKKTSHPDENDAERLDPRLVGKHHDAYWQICRNLGCTRRPPATQQLGMDFVDDTEVAVDET